MLCRIDYLSRDLVNIIEVSSFGSVSVSDFKTHSKLCRINELIHIERQRDQSPTNCGQSALWAYSEVVNEYPVFPSSGVYKRDGSSRLVAPESYSTSLAMVAHPRCRWDTYMWRNPNQLPRSTLSSHQPTLTLRRPTMPTSSSTVILLVPTKSAAQNIEPCGNVSSNDLSGSFPPSWPKKNPSSILERQP